MSEAVAFEGNGGETYEASGRPDLRLVLGGAGLATAETPSTQPEPSMYDEVDMEAFRAESARLAEWHKANHPGKPKWGGPQFPWL